MSKRRFCNFHLLRNILYCWKIWDLIMWTWRIRMERSPNIITAAISSKTTRTLQLKLSDLHNNLLTFLMPCLFNILMPFMSDVIKKELTSCKLSLWGQMERLMDMEPTCLTSTLMTLIQTILQKSTLQLLEMDRSGSILIFTVVEKFVSVS